MDVFGQALTDHYRGHEHPLRLHNNYGKPEPMPVDVFFREADELTELETMALRTVKGTILDIGAGAGVHSIMLQALNFDVTALERCQEACTIMRSRGIKSIINTDIMNYEGGKFDTLLLMMNGIGLCGDMDGLHQLLIKLQGLMKPNGQILFDSSDIAYLYEGRDYPADRYYGEISYQYEYRGQKGDWFKWLYIDQERMKAAAAACSLKFEMVFEDDMDQYLAKLSRI